MRRILSAGVFWFALVLMTLSSAYAGYEPFYGEISLFSGYILPRGYAYCDGRRLPIMKYQALYTVIGSTYGGDNKTYFCLPNYKALEVPQKGLRYIIALYGIYPSRSY